MGSLPHCEGMHARRDTASGRPGEGHPQPAWRGAGWLVVSAFARVGTMKEMRSWREVISELKSGNWSDKGLQGCQTGNGHSGKHKHTVQRH